MDFRRDTFECARYYALISHERYDENAPTGAARQRNPLLTQEERNAEARFDRAMRAARAKLSKAFDNIEAATAQQHEKLREARDRLDEAIAIQDEWRHWRVAAAQTTDYPGKDSWEVEQST